MPTTGSFSTTEECTTQGVVCISLSVETGSRVGSFTYIIFAFVFIQHIGVSPGEFAFSVFSTFSSPNALDSVYDVFKYDEAPTEK